MAEDQRAGRIFGVLFILTFITSIGALALFQSVLDDPAGYIAGGGKDNQIYLGAFLEFLLVLSNVATAVVLYPIARRQNEYLAIGYVGARIIESVFIAAGIVFILGVVSLRTDSPHATDLAVSRVTSIRHAVRFASVNAAAESNGRSAGIRLTFSCGTTT